MLMRGKVVLVCLVVLMLLLILLLLGKCAQKGQTYGLPPTQEELTQLLAEHNLAWQVTETRLAADGSITAYSLADDAGSTCNLNSVNEEGYRGININVVLPLDYTAEQCAAFFAEEWPAWCDVVAALYGSAKEATKIYRDFAAFAKDKDGTVDSRLNWFKQAGENNYRVNLQAYNNSGAYLTYGTQIMNTSLYRRDVLFRVLTNMVQAGPNSNTIFSGQNPVTIVSNDGELSAYKNLFTAKAYEKFMEDGWPGLWLETQMYTFPRSLVVEVSTDIKDTQRKNFTLTIVYGSDTAAVYGYAQFSQDNLLTDFAITDDSEFRSMLE